MVPVLRTVLVSRVGGNKIREEKHYHNAVVNFHYSENGKSIEAFVRLVRQRYFKFIFLYMRLTTY